MEDKFIAELLKSLEILNERLKFVSPQYSSNSVSYTDSIARNICDITDRYIQIRSMKEFGCFGRPEITE